MMAPQDVPQNDAVYIFSVIIGFEESIVILFLINEIVDEFDWREVEYFHVGGLGEH